MDGKVGIPLQALGTASHKSPETLLDRLHKAAAESNLEDYFACFDKNGRFIGTDASENWSASEFMVYASPHFKSKNGWEYRPLKDSRKLSYINAGQVVNSVCLFDELLESVSFRIICRGTGALVFNEERESWLLLSYHLSFPIPNEIAEETCKRISAYQLSSDDEKAKAAAEELIAMEEIAQDVGNASKSKKSKQKSKKK